MYQQLEQNLLNSNITSIRTCNMVNFGPPAAEIISLVWGNPANFNGFRFFAALCTVAYSSSGRQPNFAVLNMQRAPPVFNRAAITLGIGPSAHILVFSSFLPRLISADADWMSTVAAYIHTWTCGLSANSGCRSETCGTRLPENAGPKNRQRFVICAPSHTSVGLYLRN